MAWYEVQFGKDKAGLATVGYRLYDNTNSDTVARTTTDVEELNGGGYGVEITTIPSNTVGIEWDTGDAAAVKLYASESIWVDTIIRKKLLTLAQFLGLK